MLNVTLVGDINLKRAHKMNADTALALVSEELGRADVRLANLEGAFSDPSVDLKYKHGWHHVEPEMSVALTGLFDAVACANNVHYGTAIIDSVTRLDELGIAHCGAGANREAARQAAVVESGGLKVGVLAFTSVFWPIGAAATDTEPGVSTIKAYQAYQPHPRAMDMPGGPARTLSWADDDQLAAACADVAALRKEVDVVVVYTHWGVALETEPCDYQRQIGHALIDAGADVVAGSSPHIPQGVERYGRGAILYSLANFVFGHPGRRPDTRTGLIARASFGADGLSGLEIVPVVRNDDDQAVLLDVNSGEGASIAEFVLAASDRLDTTASIVGDSVHIKLA